MLYTYLRAISETSSRNEKISILTELANSEYADIAKSVFVNTYDPRINYWVTEFDEEIKTDLVQSSQCSLELAMDLLTPIKNRTITGNKAKEHISNIFSSLLNEDAEIFRNVIKRDLRCGISASTINKAFPNLIYEHPYMRCSSFSEKTLSNIKFPCYSQVKMDGLYVDIVISQSDVKIYTRNGSDKTEQYRNDDLFSYLIEKSPDTVLMGEAILKDDNNSIMTRKESNGILNSDDIDISKLYYYVWDIVPLEDYKNLICNTKYAERFNQLTDFVINSHPNIVVVNTKICSDAQDIIEHFKQVRLLGEEGTVIKDYKGIWKDGTSKHQIKCKVVFDCDLKVVGFKYGTGKNERKLGALLCETSDGKLKVSVGTGYKDVERESFLLLVEYWIASEQIVTVKGNDVINDINNPEEYSIFLPRFVEVRKDKAEADSLESVQQQVKSFTDLLSLISKD